MKTFFKRKIVILFVLFLILILTIIFSFNRLVIGTSSNSSGVFIDDIWIEIPVSINDRLSSFIFDTGSNMSILNKSSASKYGVTILPINLIRVNKSTYHRLGIIKKLKFNDTEFRNVIVVLVDFKKDDNRLKTSKSDLIIGMNLINKLIWNFDFDNNQYFTSQKEISSNEYDINNITYKGNRRPLIDIKIDNTSTTVLFDLGYNTSVILPHIKNYTKEYIDYNSPNTTSILGDYTDFGKSILKNVILGTDTLKTQKILYNDRTFGLIGLQCFKKYKSMTINPYKKEIELVAFN